MHEEELTRLVEAVTAQVLDTLARNGAATVDRPALPPVLVLGDAKRLPEKLFAHCRPATLEELARAGCISAFDCVIIESLTTKQLASLALGLPSDDACRAVMSALLEGVPVFMADDAPAHRAFQGRGSAALYALLEGYVRQLMIFGVKPLNCALDRSAPTSFTPPVPQEQRASRAVFETHAQPNYDRLVTEAHAVRLCAEANGAISLAPGTLVTPAARDVFAAAGVTVTIECKQP